MSAHTVLDADLATTAPRSAHSTDPDRLAIEPRKYASSRIATG